MNSEIDALRAQNVYLAGRLGEMGAELDSLYLRVTQEKTRAAWEALKAELDWFRRRELAVRPILESTCSDNDRAQLVQELAQWEHDNKKP